jgi:hypothetical protein
MNVLFRPEKCIMSKKFAKVCPHNSLIKQWMYTRVFFSQKCVEARKVIAIYMAKQSLQHMNFPS